MCSLSDNRTLSLGYESCTLESVSSGYFTVEIHPLARESIKCEVGMHGTEAYREKSCSQPALLPRTEDQLHSPTQTRLRDKGPGGQTRLPSSLLSLIENGEEEIAPS